MCAPNIGVCEKHYDRSARTWIKTLTNVGYLLPSLIQRQSPSVDRSTVPGWQVFLSVSGVLRNRHLSALSQPTSRRMLQDRQSSIPESLLPDPERPRMEWTLPGLISLFLPEFPHRNFPGQFNFQVEHPHLRSHCFCHVNSSTCPILLE